METLFRLRSRISIGFRVFAGLFGSADSNRIADALQKTCQLGRKKHALSAAEL
jgi:hypothetical protein